MSNKLQTALKKPVKSATHWPDLPANPAAVNEVREQPAHYAVTPVKSRAVPATHLIRTGLIQAEHFARNAEFDADDDVYLHHRIISEGLPAATLKVLNQQVPEWTAAEFASAINISVRTYQRKLLDSSALLSVEHSDGVWQFSELLSLAISVFGSRETAARWFKNTLPALGQRTPLELLATSAGKRIVADYLNRIASGVYA